MSDRWRDMPTIWARTMAFEILLNFAELLDWIGHALCSAARRMRELAGRIGCLLFILIVSACTHEFLIHDFLKDAEHRAYDNLANAVSQYCTNIPPRLAIEISREIRQRGQHGPPGPKSVIVVLDEKTAYADGPVIQIWCWYEHVPSAVWPLLVRDWRD